LIWKLVNQGALQMDLSGIDLTGANISHAALMGKTP
jgi:hypothetical protein